MTATLPLWAIYVAGVGSPVAAFLAVLAGNWVSRRGQKEAQERERRAEALKVLQWASELAVSEDEAKAAVGVAQLHVLVRFDLDRDIQDLVDAALDCVIALPGAEMIEFDPTGVLTDQATRQKGQIGDDPGASRRVPSRQVGGR